MDVLVVESPAKAKTINKYLGAGYTVLASYRPCPRPAGQGRLGPARTRTSPWTGRSTPAAEKHVDAIAKALTGRRASSISPPTRIARARRSPGMCGTMLARKKALKGVDVKRVTFNEITKQRRARRHRRIRATSTSR